MFSKSILSFLSVGIFTYCPSAVAEAVYFPVCTPPQHIFKPEYIPEENKCPTRWVELVSLEPDVLEGLFLCRDTGKLIGQFNKAGNNTGCVDAEGLAEFPGDEWGMPESEELAQSERFADLRDEIMEYAIDPCLLVLVKRNRVDGLSINNHIRFIKVTNPEAFKLTSDQMLSMVTKMDNLEDRLIVYEFGKNKCIEGEN